MLSCARNFKNPFNPIVYFDHFSRKNRAAVAGMQYAALKYSVSRRRQYFGRFR